MRFKTVLSTGLAVLFISMAGCGERNPLTSLDKVNDTNIKRLHAFYTMYKGAHNNVGPESKEELLEYLTSDNTAKVLIERMKVDDVESVFTSERDSQPFKIKWGATGIENHAIIFEAEGLEGKRFVAFTNPREVDASDYDKYWEESVTGEEATVSSTGSLDDFMENMNPEDDNRK